MSKLIASLDTMSMAEKARYWNDLMTIPEPTVGARLTTHTILLLQKAGIPSLPWGWGPLAFAGDNMGISERVDRQEFRGLIRIFDRYHFVTEFHFHIGSKTTLSLIKKEDIFWWLPDLKLGDPDAQDPHLTLSTDPRLPARLPQGPSGPWFRLPAVKILKPSAFTEAVILLLMKDIGSNPFPFRTPGRSPIDQLWDAFMVALSDSNRPEEYQKQISPRFQKVWDYMCHKRPKEINRWVPFFRLRYVMIKNSVLPGNNFSYHDITKLKGGEA